MGCNSLAVMDDRNPSRMHGGFLMSCIGSHPRLPGDLFHSFGLARLRRILTPEDFSRVAKQVDCAPERPRPLIPEVVGWLMMLVALHRESMTQGLIRAWARVRTICPDLPECPVSEEAFCQARKQLPLSFWRTLSDRLRRRYEARFDSAMRWKWGLRVLAVDGSDVDLPNHPRLVRFFTRPKNGKGEAKRPQGRLVAMCSVFTGFCVAFKFTSLKFTEHTALAHLIRRLRRKDLLLLDCGFFSLRGHLAHHLPQGPFPHADFQSGRRIRQTNAMHWATRVDCPVSSFPSHSA